MTRTLPATSQVIVLSLINLTSVPVAMVPAG
jgi:hypothetical protein